VGLAARVRPLGDRERAAPRSCVRDDACALAPVSRHWPGPWWLGRCSHLRLGLVLGQLAWNARGVGVRGPAGGAHGCLAAPLPRAVHARDSDPLDDHDLGPVLAAVVTMVPAFAWARVETEQPASHAEYTSEFAGCYQLEVGRWIPPTMLGHSVHGLLPARIQLDTTRGNSARDHAIFERSQLLIRPGWDGAAYWIPISHDRVHLTWNTGFNGVGVDLRRHGNELRGKARGHTDVGGPWPNPRARVRARPIDCALSPRRHEPQWAAFKQKCPTLHTLGLAVCARVNAEIPHTLTLRDSLTLGARRRVTCVTRSDWPVRCRTLSSVGGTPLGFAPTPRPDAAGAPAVRHRLLHSHMH
jgi:hypothetical protein